MASSSKPKRIYQVFLSFRGEDVRDNFLSHLYTALCENGICAFQDSEELMEGDQMSSVVMKAIEDSRIAIIIFSENYASSRWCLEELAEIMEYKVQKYLIVLPVFYKVEPREVRRARESYGRALTKHESDFGKDSEKVKRWKEALFDASNLSGWYLNDGDESRLVRSIVKEISIFLDQTPLHVAKHLVGIDSRVAELKSMLNLDFDDGVVMVGLWGQGGVGKTTLAKALYNAIFRQFWGSFFLENVQQVLKTSKDLVLLQENLLSRILSLHQRLEVSNVIEGINLIQGRLHNKKVLIVLDDVDDLNQLNALVGKSEWFGNGSRIILTTRDYHLLTCHGIDQGHVYRVKALDDIEAHELLSNHVLMTHKRLEIRTDLVDSVLNHASGLPLALEVMGSILCDRREDEWESTVDRLSRMPNKTINDVLKISYDGLEDNEKEIFLHIACFFNRRSSAYVKRVLDSCGFDATVGLKILIERSLISIDEYGFIKVHLLIQLMGMDIVKQESCDDPRRRSRLWLYDDVVDVLSRDMGDCVVQAIVLEPPEPIEIWIEPHAFTKMERLRLLIMRNVHCSLQDSPCFPNELRWLEWSGIQFSPGPKESVGVSFSEHGILREPKKLVGLDLSKRGILVEPNKLEGPDFSEQDILVEPEQSKELKLPSFPLESLQTSVATIEHVIGIDDRVKEVIKLLDIKDNEVGVRIVGIHGPNGIGKTTIAKAVYDQLSSCFDSCSFLEDIEETIKNGSCSFLEDIGETTKNGGSIQFVQTKLICDILGQDGDVASFEGEIEFFLDVFRDIKVLIVLDDVEDQSHLNALVGDQLDWFGPGSRIIVTSENGEILQGYDSGHLSHTYKVEGMDGERAFELFCNHALGTHGSIYDLLEAVERIIRITGQVPRFIARFIEDIAPYLESAERIIEATGQVPLVIEVISSFLRGKPLEEWRKTENLINPQKQNSQERLKGCWEILKICYEALHIKQKQIFWDIARFANGGDSRIASYMWPDQDLLPSQQFLMPLAKIGGDNKLCLHKLLKCLSRTIDQEETKYPGRCSRRFMQVTDPDEINRQEGMEEVEALCFDLKNLHPHPFTETDFKSMPNIRFLKLDQASMTGNFTKVFRKLRWLSWEGCPRDFKATEFSLAELIILDLSRSKVTGDWGDWRLIKMEQLKVLNLTSCADLLISPEFSSFPNLEMLILERCSRLVHLRPSVGGLEKLICLNLKSCTELNRLPAELGALKALKELLIDETSVRDISLGSDSKEVECLTSLSILSANNSKITKLPNGLGEKLQRLSLRNCHWIQELPESIGQSGSPLEELDISGTGISELPGSFVKLHRLRVLKMDDCFIKILPSFIWHLHSLEEIHASLCRNIEEEIPGDIGKLENLRILRLRNSTISSLPPEIEHLSQLETLDILHCDKLHELPALPPNLVNVHLSTKLKEKMSHLWDKHCFITV